MSLIDRYRLAFDISPVPMLLVSGDGVIVLANEDFLTLFEYELDELIGLNVEVLVPKAIRAHHPDLRNAYHRVPTKRNMGAGRDLNGVTKSGKIVPLELGLEPVSEGLETMALVAAIDIRQRKAHEERMLLAMDAAASAMVMVNEKGRIVFVNRTASLLFGYDETELMDRRIEMLVPEEFRRAHPVYTGSFMSDSSTRAMGRERDLFARHKDGTQIPVEITLTPVTTPDERLVMSTIVDLSERVAAAEAVALKTMELETLNTDLSQFAYSASHDLKAPLSSIAGLLSLCIEDLDDGNIEEVRQNMTTAIEISQRSAQKIEGILQIARTGHDATPSEHVLLEPLIQEIWFDLTAGKSETRLELDLEKADSAQTVPTTLKVILENLLSNALRYADANKSEHVIQVESAGTEDEIRITVSDNGVGIPEQNIAKVFQMFLRLDDRSHDGLGLSLVKKQIDVLGGSIGVQSVEGEGAEFHFVLPQGERT